MAEITMHPLVSSNLAAAGYDAETATLRIAFTSGSTYSYSNVPPEIFSGLMSAPSAGSYFARNVKGRYAYEQET